VTDRPIIFSGPMVRALLDGRKTQTRRLAASPLRRAEVGDRLWVRETFRHWQGSASGKTAVYAVDDQWIDWGSGERFVEKVQWLSPATPSIHMPRWASRLTLDVTAVRIEHLQAISVFDAAAEGHPRSDDAYPEDVHLDAARDWYMDLWDSLHPKQPWSSNPPVVVLEFEVRQANIDA
jgi:hypothetical protein